MSIFYEQKQFTAVANSVLCVREYCAIDTRGAAVFELRQLLVGANTPAAPTAPFVAYYS
jgi:hypothetical protein